MVFHLFRIIRIHIYFRKFVFVQLLQRRGPGIGLVDIVSALVILVDVPFCVYAAVGKIENGGRSGPSREYLVRRRLTISTNIA
jgi:hypothetical protein